MLWAVAEPVRPKLERRGLRTAPAGLAVEERNRRFGQRFGADLAVLAPSERRAFAFAGHFAHICAPEMLDDLRRVASEWQPDLIVHEPAELVGPILAQSLGVRHATIAFSGAIPTSALQSASHALGPVWDALDVPPSPDLGLTRHAYFHPFPRSMGERPGGSTVHDLRPVMDDGPFDAEQPAWIAALGRDRPFVYVTFGTEMGGSAPWTALMPPLGALEDVDVLVTTGDAVDAHVLGTLPRHIRVEHFVPQEWLLPRCSLVVSHAGAGTLLAAIGHGVPQLLIPIGADQFDNQAAYLGTGAGASGTGLDSDALTKAMRSLLRDPTYREAAARLASELAAMAGPAQAVRVLERLDL